MIGKKLGNRYEILQKIGGGGMALVYKAHDDFLNRPVAVKVLRDQYAGDEDFVERFRREAQAAASLCHPNIVNIYDVGKQDDIHYIVMEYVEGQTLKDLVRTRGAIDVLQAVQICIDICEALDHAHRRKVIHRDIKPHNILLTVDGDVKVTDFGIARAATDSTLTHTGTVIGSVHYFSPEQARGKFTGEKSDIYSLGVVLYEMLTGSVPFDGDTAFNIAMKHVHDDVRPPRDIRQIPEELDAIVLKALEKDPGMRYQSAREMLDDLVSFQKKHGDWQDVRPRFEAPAKQEGGAAVGKGAKRSNTSGSRRNAFWYVWLVLFTIAVVVVGLAAREFLNWLNVPTIEVPDVTGVALHEAETTLRQKGLRSTVVAQRFDKTIPEGYVLSQSPEAGEVVKHGREISLVLSRGPEIVIVPDLSGKPFREADLLLKAEGLEFGGVVYEHDEVIPEDSVISQTPRPGTPVVKGTLVDLVLSKGPEPVPVLLPSFTGLKLEEAEARLKELGLVPGKVIYEEDPDFQEGVVITTNPPPGAELSLGDTVDFVVAKGGVPANSRMVTIAVPRGGSESVRVRIEVVDVTGSRTVYDERHRPGDVFKLAVNWYGREARLKVYINDVFTYEDLLRQAE
ncbi:MAG: Stk1 family PASTA domain-containing Ser/Thr kinase [Bacillota bacterium]